MRRICWYCETYSVFDISSYMCVYDYFKPIPCIIACKTKMLIPIVHPHTHTYTTNTAIYVTYNELFDKAAVTPGFIIVYTNYNSSTILMNKIF